MLLFFCICYFFFFQAEDGIRDADVTGVQTCALPILPGDADLVILPGSKSTIADLAALRAGGFDIDIAAHVRRGGTVLGLCGGYQILGNTITDPSGIEGPAGTVPGLGLLRSEEHTSEL